jgi:hypothetical protein
LPSSSLPRCLFAVFSLRRLGRAHYLGIAVRASTSISVPCVEESCDLHQVTPCRWISVSNYLSQIGLGIRASCLLPLEKLLKQRFLFLIVHRRSKAFSLLLSMSSITGVPCSLGFTRRSRRLRSLRCCRVNRRRSCLFRSPANRGTGSCGGWRNLFFPADILTDRRVRRGTVRAGPFEPSRAVLCGGVSTHHCGNTRQSGNHA